MPDVGPPKIISPDDWKSAGKPPQPVSGAAQPSPEAPSRIVVDSDWKSQAQAERERLAESERKSNAARPPSSGQGDRSARALPAADFTALVSTIVTQALLYLGGFPDPETGRALVSLDHARFHIDLLSVLDQKTKGNLAPAEAEDLTQAIHELRLRYVEISQAIAEMAKRGKAGPPPGSGDAPAH